MKVLRAAVEAMESGQPAALCTVIGERGSAPREAAARMLVYPDGRIVGTVGGGEWERRVIGAAIDALQTGQPTRFAAHLTRDLGMCCGGAMEAFIEPLELRERLHLFGAGHVSAPTAALGRDLGFEVIVYDEREEWLTPGRFPGCALVSGDPLRRLPELNERDYAVIVTHSHQLDQAILEALIGAPYAYLGMIGSKSKVAKFFVRLRAAGVDPALFPRICAPVGLDLGAETPREIAVSIAAELIRTRRRSQAPPLPLSSAPIQARGGAALPPRLSSTESAMTLLSGPVEPAPADDPSPGGADAPS